MKENIAIKLLKKDTAIKEVKGFSSEYPSMCDLKLLPNIDGTWITIQDNVGTSMTIKLSDLSDFIKVDVFDKLRVEILEEKEHAYADFDDYKMLYLNAEPDELPDDDFRYGMARALEIINKHLGGE